MCVVRLTSYHSLCSHTYLSAHLAQSEPSDPPYTLLPPAGRVVKVALTLPTLRGRELHFCWKDSLLLSQGVVIYLSVKGGIFFDFALEVETVTANKLMVGLK